MIMSIKKYPKVERLKISPEFIEKLKKENRYHVDGLCIECGKKVENRSDLVCRILVDEEEIVVEGLSGEKCIACGAVAYDLNSYHKIRKAIDESKYSGRFSIKEGYPVLYFKKELAEIMDLKEGEMVKLSIINKNEFIVKRRLTT